MSQGKIEITCLTSDSPLFTVGKRYPVEYQGGSFFYFPDDSGFRSAIYLDDNGKGAVYLNEGTLATFKHLVTLNNESL